jgi:hypothetical protein
VYGYERPRATIFYNFYTDDNRDSQASILTNCKALNTIWGRGYFYLYIGTTCILGPTNRNFLFFFSINYSESEYFDIIHVSLDLFGYYMFFVGFVMLVLFWITQKHIAQMKSMFKDDAALVEKFNKYATEGVSFKNNIMFIAFYFMSY